MKAAPFERAIQFLVCPQRDFIDRLEPGREPPNRLHVGPEAAARIRGAPGGPDPFVDATLRFYDDADPGARQVQVVIDEDWHPKSCPEFPIFGEHCVKGSPGARLVGALEDLRWHPRTHVLRANSINVAAHPQYGKILETALGGARPDRVRVGVYGVWTNVKIEYLLVNLITHPPYFPIANIAVLEPLCASPRHADHVAAIAKLEGVFGFKVFGAVEDYLAWMGLRATTVSGR